MTPSLYHLDISHTPDLLPLYYMIRNPTKRHGIPVSPTSQYGVLSGQRVPDIFSSKNNMS